MQLFLSQQSKENRLVVVHREKNFGNVSAAKTNVKLNRACSRSRPNLKQDKMSNHKGAFIIYLKGVSLKDDDFEGGGTLFPYYDLGGCGKFPTKITSSIGGQPFFFLKKKRK